MRQPGIEPGPLPWKGRILTIRPLTLRLTPLTSLVKGGTPENASQCGQTLQLGRRISYLRCHHCDGPSSDRMHETVGVSGFCHLLAFRETFHIPSPSKTSRNPNHLRNTPNCAPLKASSLSFATPPGKNACFSSFQETTV